MKNHFNVWLKRVLAVSLVLVMAAGIVGCGPKEEKPAVNVDVEL